MSSSMPNTVTSVIVAISFIIAIPLQFISAVRANTETPVLVHHGLHIVELQTRSTADASSEYLVLYNETDEPVDISDWRLEYKPGTGGNWSDKLLSTQAEGASFIVEPYSFLFLASNNYLDAFPDADPHAKIAAGSAESSGHIRLSMPDTTEEDSWWVIDQLGWGAAADSPLGVAAPAAERGTVLQRIFTDSGDPQNTYDNMTDFQVLSVESPINQVPPTNNADEVSDDKEAEPDEGVDDNSEEEAGEDDDSTDSSTDDNEDEETQTDQHTDDESVTEDQATDDTTDAEDTEEAVEELYCEGVVFSELLPNPQGPRSEFPREENAFIELYNPTNEAIPLLGCGLQTTANDDIYWLEDTLMQPETYVAFYEEDTQIQLPVSPSGTVYLLNQDEEEIETVTYPIDMPEAAAWAWFGQDDWQETYDISPGNYNQELPLKPCPQENQERNPETNRCRSTETKTLTPCLEGQERNPETNRCRSINSGPNYVPCGPNQERNPQTNRCRTVGRQQRQLVPCDEDQERNPETNRCRNITSASSNLVPCEPHQERNPETNRCRNVATPNSDVMGVQDIAVPTVEDDSNWTLALAMMSFAVGYGVWEWRHDIRNWRIRRQQSSV